MPADGTLVHCGQCKRWFQIQPQSETAVKSGRPRVGIDRAAGDDHELFEPVPRLRPLREPGGFWLGLVARLALAAHAAYCATPAALFVYDCTVGFAPGARRPAWLEFRIIQDHVGFCMR
jgi:hypothetical protein